MITWKHDSSFSPVLCLPSLMNMPRCLRVECVLPPWVVSAAHALCFRWCDCVLSGGVCELLLPDVAPLHQPESPGSGSSRCPPELSPHQPDALRPQPRWLQQCAGVCCVSSPPGLRCDGDKGSSECPLSPQEQASWVCQCEDRVVLRLQQDFKMTLLQQNSLEQWASWLSGVVSQVLKPYEHNPVALPKAAKVFLLNWSFYRWAQREML